MAFREKNGIRCILNPAPGQAVDMGALVDLDYFVPNESEAETITGFQSEVSMTRRSAQTTAACRRNAPSHYYARREWILAGWERLSQHVLRLR